MSGRSSLTAKDAKVAKEKKNQDIQSVRVGGLLQ
jgi:hypothetical protein